MTQTKMSHKDLENKFHMCFWIRILNPFYHNTLRIPNPFRRGLKNKTKICLVLFELTDLSKQTLKWENCASTDRFLRIFEAIKMLDWVLFRCPNETGSKFSVQNTCGKIKSDFYGRLELKIIMWHPFWVTLHETPNLLI